MLPKLPDTVYERAGRSNEPLLVGSRNRARPDTEGVREDEGVDVALDRKCSVLATSLTSYWSEIVMFLEFARE